MCPTPGNAGEGLLCPMLHSLGQCEVQSQSNMAASGGQGSQWSYLHPAPLSSVTIFLSSSSVLYSSWEAWRNPWQAKGFTSKERCATGVSNAGNQRSLRLNKTSGCPCTLELQSVTEAGRAVIQPLKSHLMGFLYPMLYQE